jgi:hypothetical protein
MFDEDGRTSGRRVTPTPDGVTAGKCAGGRLLKYDTWPSYA